MGEADSRALGAEYPRYNGEDLGRDGEGDERDEEGSHGRNNSLETGRQKEEVKASVRPVRSNVGLLPEGKGHCCV